jgi:GNAT superfamily N-acetyltransferase
MTIVIQPLQSHHDTEAFRCGVAALDIWFRTIAKQHIRKGISRTFVAVDAERDACVLGFYSLTVGEADTSSLPETLARKLPGNIPIVLIGRLATATDSRARGFGGCLLVDALQRTVRVASDVGIAAVLVDAKDDVDAAFYEHFGFVRLPELPNRLVMPVETARQALMS